MLGGGGGCAAVVASALLGTSPPALDSLWNQILAKKLQTHNHANYSSSHALPPLPRCAAAITTQGAAARMAPQLALAHLRAARGEGGGGEEGRGGGGAGGRGMNVRLLRFVRRALVAQRAGAGAGGSPGPVT